MRKPPLDAEVSEWDAYYDAGDRAFDSEVDSRLIAGTSFPRHLWVVEWCANEHGYQVVARHPEGNIVDRHTAGNHRQDSIRCVPPGDPDCLRVDLLRVMAYGTAVSMAVENNIPEANIRENAGLLTEN